MANGQEAALRKWDRALPGKDVDEKGVCALESEGGKDVRNGEGQKEKRLEMGTEGKSENRRLAHPQTLIAPSHPPAPILQVGD